MYLQEIKLIDLRNSLTDPEKTDKEKGVYEFLEKKYIDYSGNSGEKPPYHFAWCRYAPWTTPPYRDLWDWERQWGYTPVTTADPFWPDGVPPNGEGKYVVGDVILVKTPLKNYLKKRKEEIEASERRPAAVLRQFYTEAVAMGADPNDPVLRKYCRVDQLG